MSSSASLWSLRRALDLVIPGRVWDQEFIQGGAEAMFLAFHFGLGALSALYCVVLFFSATLVNWIVLVSCIYSLAAYGVLRKARGRKNVLAALKVSHSLLLVVAHWLLLEKHCQGGLSHPTSVFLATTASQNLAFVFFLAFFFSATYLFFFIVIGLLFSLHLHKILVLLGRVSLEERPLLVEVFVALAFQGVIMVVFLVTVDLTFSKLGHQLQTLTKAKDAFLGRMSHELRTPLSAMWGFAQNLLEVDGRERDPREKEILNSLISSSEVAIDLVDRVLDWTDLKEVVTQDNFSVLDIESGTQSVCHPVVAARNLSLSFSYANDLDKMLLCGDFRRIRQIVISLVSNATKYANHEISVSLQLQQPNATTAVDQALSLHVTVSDDGVGFDLEDPSVLFQPFFRADKSTPGHGLGLAIAHDVVLKMGGSLSASSCGKGMGATFVFCCPVSISKEQAISSGVAVADALVIAPSIAAVKAVPRNSVLKILVVEDDPVLSAVLGSQLKRVQVAATVKLEIHICDSGMTAVAKIEEEMNARQHFRLIFTDIHMGGGINGFELATLVRMKENMTGAAKEEKARIVGCSSMVDKTTSKEAARIFDNFLTKPLLVKHIQKEVDAAAAVVLSAPM